MSFFDRLRGKREHSSDIARERLLTVLVHERAGLTPEVLNRMKAEISEVIARYVPTADSNAIEVTLLRGDVTDHIKADIPLRRTAN